MSNQIDVSLIYNNYTNEKIDNDKSIIIKKYNNVKKNANYTSDNQPLYELILLLSNLIPILWFIGYGAMMRCYR